jgi:hypothetical protein
MLNLRGPRGHATLPVFVTRPAQTEPNWSREAKLVICEQTIDAPHIMFVRARPPAPIAHH